jgi:hypothetical protein
VILFLNKNYKNYVLLLSSKFANYTIVGFVLFIVDCDCDWCWCCCILICDCVDCVYDDGIDCCIKYFLVIIR